MTLDVIPAGRVMSLLAECSERRGLNAQSFSGGVYVMCAACHPTQPERLQYSARRVRPLSLPGEDRWWKVLHEECDGLVKIHYATPPDSRTLLMVDGLAESLVVTTCCHEEGDGLGQWDWRADLEAALREATVTTEADDWADGWAEQQRRHEAETARRRAMNAAHSAGRALTARERVQATAAVLKAAGKPVSVEQSRVAWDCGHVTDNGDISQIVVIVDSDGLPVRAASSCGIDHGTDDAEPTFEALAAEYASVAAMEPDERAKYQPVREVRSGRRWGSRSSASPKAAGPSWTVDGARAWLAEHQISTDQGIQAIYAQAKAIPSHPPRAIISKVKAAGPSA